MRPWRSCARSLVRLADAGHNTRETEVSPYALSEDSSSRPHAPAVDSGRRHPIRRSDADRAGSSWRYNDSGSNLGTAWRAPAYNDASWPAGPAQLGYGDGDESTVLSYGASTTNRRITYYFRRAFTVANPAAFAALTSATFATTARSSISTASKWSAPTCRPAPIDLHDARDDGHRRRRRERVARGAGRSVAARHGRERRWRWRSTSSRHEHRHQLRSRAAGDGGPAAPAVTLDRSGEPGVTNTSAVDVQRLGVGPGRARERHLICTAAPPQTVVFSGPLRCRTRRSPRIRRPRPTAAARRSTSMA